MLLLLISPVVAQSAPQKNDQSPRILALGDSMMAWHLISRNSISDALAKSLGEPVESRAITGARIIYNLPISGAMGLNISRQYHGEEVDWVVMSGGGNDLWFGCGCRQCDRKMARMISPTGRTGDIPALVDRIRSTGAQVVYIGYLRSPGVDSAIDACRDLGDELEERLSRMTAQRNGVYFLDVSNLVPYGDRSYHGADMIHPSRKASAIIGAKVAQIIRRFDATR